MKQACASALAIAAIGLSPLANAQVYENTATATFNVTLVVQADCTIAANPLNFGTAGILNTNVDAETTLDVTCTASTPYNIGLSAGDAPGSTVENRVLVGSAETDTVDYQLYQDSARTLLWGDTQPTDTLSGVGTGTAQAIPVYGRIPTQDTPPPDTYQSTVTATVYF